MAVLAVCLLMTSPILTLGGSAFAQPEQAGPSPLVKPSLDLLMRQADSALQSASAIPNKALVGKVLTSIMAKPEALSAVRAMGIEPVVRPTPQGLYLLKALVTKADIPRLYYLPGVVSMAVKAQPFIQDLSMKDPEMGPAIDMPRVREIVQANEANALGYTGAGVRIAIVDTGVDYAVPDLRDALDYVSGQGWREPLVMDADEGQVLTFVTLSALNGTLPSYNLTVTTYTPFEVKLTIPANATVAGIPSASGNYKLGMTYEDVTVATVQHAVLLTDPSSPGNYTRIYVDFSDTLNFTAAPHYDYDGDRITHLDDSDGFPIDTVGVAGGFFFDQFMWFSFPAAFLEGWSLSGDYLSFFYDFEGHGTQTSGSAAARGVVDYYVPGYYSIYGFTKLTGVAPDAKIVGVKGLYWGNVEPGMLWAAGFDVDSHGNYVWSGQKRADIISNSWGISSMTYDLLGAGYDFESMFLNGIMTPGFLDPSYPGVLIINAAGNGGYGYGTVTSPGTAHAPLTVAASTSNLFRAPPENTSFQADQIISWSARSPTPAGEIKPEVANVGAFGYTVARVYDGLVAVFGGTSMATPLTAAVAALTFQAAGGSGPVADPFSAKALLVNTADDLGNEPFQQGAGRVNALRAVMAALRLSGKAQTFPPTPQLSVTTSFSNAASEFDQAFKLQWDALIQSYFSIFFAQSIPHGATDLPSYWNVQSSGTGYLGRVLAGYSASFTLNVRNTDPSPVNVEVTPYVYAKVKASTSTITMTSSSGGNQFLLYYDPAQFSGTDLARFSLSVPFDKFDPSGQYYNDFFYYLYVYDWYDANGDGIVQTGERNLIDYSYQSGTHLEVYVANLAQKVPSGHTVLVRIRAFGPTDTVTLQYGMVTYRRAADPTVFVSPKSYPVSAGATLPITVVVTTGYSDAPGPHEGFLLVKTSGAGGSSTQMVPFSYVVTMRLTGGVQALTPQPSDEGTLYDLGAVRGGFDWAWRAESGDWRAYSVYLDDPSAYALEVDFSWQDSNSSLRVLVMGPDGEWSAYTLSYYLGSGVYVWMGTGTSSGPQNRAVVFAPADYTYGSLSSLKKANRGGFFTILIQETLHGGLYLSERVVGTVRALHTSPRLPTTMNVPRGSTVTLATSMTVPYSMVAGGGVPSVNISAETSSPSLTVAPSSFSFTYNFSPDSPVNTLSLPLKLTVSSTAAVGTELVVVWFFANIPDLTVWMRSEAGMEARSSIYPFVDSVLVNVT